MDGKDLLPLVGVALGWALTQVAAWLQRRRERRRRLEGIVAPMMLHGAMTARAFEAYIEQCLAPELRPGDVVVLDRLSAHKTERVRELIEATGARLAYLPAYSPDFNPIENAWSKLKALLRKAGARTLRKLRRALRWALLEITSDDASCPLAPRAEALLSSPR